MSDIIDFDVLLGKERAPRRPRRKRSWLTKLTLLAFVLAIGARLSLGYVLPDMLERLSNRVGMDLQFEDMHVSLLSGSVEFEDLHVTPSGEPSGESDTRPDARAQRVELKLDMWALASQELRILDAQVFGAVAHVHRDPEGRWGLEDLQDRWDRGTRSSGMESTILETISIHDLNLHVHDRDRDVVQGRVQINGAKPSMAGGGTQWSVQLLDAPWAVELVCAWGEQDGEIVGDLRAQGLRAAPFEPWLQDMGLRVSTTSHDLQTVWKYADNPELGTRLELKDTRLKADGQMRLQLDSMHVGIVEVSRSGLWLQTAQIHGLNMQAERTDQGAIVLAGVGSAPEASTPAAWNLSLQRLELPDAKLHWTDRTTEQPTTFEAALAGHLEPLGWSPTAGLAASQVNLELSGSGLADSLVIVGEVQANLPGSCDLRLKGDGLELQALAPYLAQIGIESRLEDARLDLRLKAGWQGTGADRIATVSMRDFYWKNRGEVARMNLLHATFERGPGARGAWKQLSVQGSEFALERDGSGALGALGFARLPAGMATDWPGLPQVQIEDMRVSIADPLANDSNPTQEIHVRRADLENWLGFEQAAPSTWNIDAELPGITEDLLSAGEFRSTDGGDWNGEFALTGLREGPITEWLHGQGLQTDLEGGRLTFGLQANGQNSEEGWLGQATVRNLEFGRGEVHWLEMARLELQGLKLHSDQGPTWQALNVEAPKLSVTHMANGDWLAAGFSWKDAAKNSTGSHLPWQVLSPTARNLFQASGPSIAIVDAELSLRDESVQPPLESQLMVRAHGRDEMQTEVNLQTGPQSERTWSLHLQSATDDAALDLVGSHFENEGTTHWQAELEVVGSKALELNAYLPEHLTVDLDQKRLVGRWKGLARPSAPGGIQIEVDSDHMALAHRGTALFMYDDLRLEIPRLDVDEGVLSVGPVVCNGLEMEWERDADGALHALGWTLDRAGWDALPETWSQALRSAEPQRTDGSNRLFVGPIDLAASRLEFRDASSDAPRVAHARGRMTMPTRFTWGYDSSGEPAPLEVQLQGSLEGLCKDARMDLRATPFAATPSLEIDLAADGLQGRNLSAWLPDSLDAQGLSDLHGGRVSGHLGLDLELPESARPWSAAFDHGFGAYLTVEDFKLLENPISPPLVAFDLLQITAPKVHRTHGRVERIELWAPNVRTWQDHQGLHAGGLLWPAIPDWNGGVAGDWRVQEVRMHDVRWDHRDRSVQPMWHLPIRAGQVEAFDLATHFQDGDPAMRLHASLRGGEVSLPLREPDTLEALLRLEAGSNGAAEGQRGMETRRAFELLEIHARVSGLARPEASMTVDGTAFELAGLAGLARGHGLRLQDGLLDQNHVLRLHPDTGFTWNATHQTDLLSLEEIQPGAFAAARDWPCDLGTFLRGLRDGEGGRRLSMQVQLPAGWPGSGDLARALDATLQRTAVASHAKAREMALANAAPANGPAGGGLQIEFAPASAHLSAATRAKLTRWLEKNRRPDGAHLQLSHTFGLEDLNRAQRLGTPPTAALQQLLAKLRRRKTRLAGVRRSDESAAVAAAQSGDMVELGRARGALTGLDRQQMANEQALDRVLHLLTPGSERRTNRRTRSAALSLAQLRQEAVVRFLRDHGWPTSGSPIQARPPQFTHRNPGQGGRIVLQFDR